MVFRLDGKTALITGAGSGIGREIALLFAAQGATVAIGDIDDAAAQAVAGEITSTGGTAVAVRLDVTRPESARSAVASTVETAGSLDILVNNAGILRDRMLVNMTEEEWDAVINVHLKGTFAPSRWAAAYWRDRSKAGEANDARIINTSSASGIYGNVGQANYGAAKAGIAAFTVIAAQELGRYGVTVNCLAPNARTRMTENIFGAMPAPAEGEYDPLDPVNISPVVVALCTDDAKNITGQCFFIYGSTINVLKPWDVGTFIQQDDNVWDPDQLAAQMKQAFPDGIAPVGMMEMLSRASGQAG